MRGVSRLRVGPDVVTQDLGDGLVLLNLRTGIYWGLNRTGAVVWRGIENHSGIENICRQLREEFEAHEDDLAAAVRSLLSELAEQRLIVEMAKSEGEASPSARGGSRRAKRLKKLSAAKPARKKKK